MPLHKGHMALIEFARQRCDLLYVVLCHTKKEPIDGAIRASWLNRSFAAQNNIKIINYEYDESMLPNTSASSMSASKLWAAAFKSILPEIDVIFTSELYGDYLAQLLGAQHIPYDFNRVLVPVSATMIREQPIANWDYIADTARPYFVKKILLAGTESTGKSTLAKLLASHYLTTYVPEMARRVIGKTSDCTPNDLETIATLHAKAIETGLQTANKILFVDTDLITTCSYARFLFGKDLVVPGWVEEANKFDLHLFLEPDCDYIQDGTRLSQEQRNALSDHHKEQYAKAGIRLISVNGNWHNRFLQARSEVERFIFPKKSSNQN